MTYRTAQLSVLFLQDEPLSPEDDVDRQLKNSKVKSLEDDSAEIEAASFKKFPVEVNALTRVCGCGCGCGLNGIHDWTRPCFKISPCPPVRRGHRWAEYLKKTGWNGCGGWG